MASYRFNVAEVKGLNESLFTDGGKPKKLKKLLSGATLEKDCPAGLTICVAGMEQVQGLFHQRGETTVPTLDPETHQQDTITVEKINSTPFALFTVDGRLETYKGSPAALAKLGSFLQGIGVGCITEALVLDLVEILDRLKKESMITALNLRGLKLSEFAASSFCWGRYTPAFESSEAAFEFIEKNEIKSEHLLGVRLELQYDGGCTIKMNIGRNASIGARHKGEELDCVYDICRWIAGWRGMGL